MWNLQTDPLNNYQGLKFFVERDAQPASYLDVIQGWRDDPTFRSLFNAALADAPYAAFRWETPPVDHESTTRPFEFVLLDSPRLARAPNPDAFAEHFDRSPGKAVLIFPNLGGDALLIVPRPQVDRSAYGHLAAFVRGAPESQRQTLWRLAGESMLRRLNHDRPVWLNTAGGGVSWLHVRLDDRPKYYRHRPYRQHAA
jgi:hypothetical protein